MSYPEVQYTADDGELSATLRPAATPPDLWIGTGTVIGHLATGATTDGAFGLYRTLLPGPPSGPMPHFHRTMSESFYVLSGTVRFSDGRTWFDGRPGDFLHVPPGGVHGFRNESGEPTELLLLFTPGAPRERYFEELAEIAAARRTLSPEEWTELYARHDQYMV